MKRFGAVFALVVAAVPVAAQQPSPVQDFADGFTFLPRFSNSRTDADGSVVFTRNAADVTRVASVRQGADPCVFLSISLNLNTASFAAPVVLLEETYDLRGVTFEANPKHEFAPPGGVYLMMSGPRILCRVSTGGSLAKLDRRGECGDKFEVTIEAPMMPAFTRTAERLKGPCRWR